MDRIKNGQQSNLNQANKNNKTIQIRSLQNSIYFLSACFFIISIILYLKHEHMLNLESTSRNCNMLFFSNPRQKRFLLSPQTQKKAQKGQNRKVKKSLKPFQPNNHLTKNKLTSIFRQIQQSPQKTIINKLSPNQFKSQQLLSNKKIQVFLPSPRKQNETIHEQNYRIKINQAKSLPKIKFDYYELENSPFINIKRKEDFKTISKQQIRKHQQQNKLNSGLSYRQIKYVPQYRSINYLPQNRQIKNISSFNQHNNITSFKQVHSLSQFKQSPFQLRSIHQHRNIKTSQQISMYKSNINNNYDHINHSYNHMNNNQNLMNRNHMIFKSFNNNINSNNNIINVNNVNNNNVNNNVYMKKQQQQDMKSTTIQVMKSTTMELNNNQKNQQQYNQNSNIKSSFNQIFQFSTNHTLNQLNTNNNININTNPNDNSNMNNINKVNKPKSIISIDDEQDKNQQYWQNQSIILEKHSSNQMLLKLI